LLVITKNVVRIQKPQWKEYYRKHGLCPTAFTRLHHQHRPSDYFRFSDPTEDRD